jgi:hypothetical protein
MSKSNPPPESVIKEISPNDVMYASGPPERYWELGEDAVQASLASGRENDQIPQVFSTYRRVTDAYSEPSRLPSQPLD